MSSKIADKVVVYFYEDTTDMLILEFLNQITRRRNFSNKIKDILLEYIKQNNININTNNTESQSKPNNEVAFTLSDWDED